MAKPLAIYVPKRKRTDAGTPRTYHGKRVIDASQPLYFVVIEKDRRMAVPNSPTGCAGACAIKRENPNIVGVYMHRSVTFVEYVDRVVRYRTSHALRDQLIRHDASEKAKIVFDLGKYHVGAVPRHVIASRGKQHSKPDRARGAKNSQHARKAAVPLRHALGREEFHFTNIV